VLNSLRFRLPALFLAGIALSGLVTSLIALRLFQDYTRTASLNELRREARGLAQLYAESAVRAVDEEKAAPAFAASKLEAATFAMQHELATRRPSATEVGRQRG